ncbi:hypothetical protein COOONC_21905 [Cooperia oncophora]
MQQSRLRNIRIVVDAILNHMTKVNAQYGRNGETSSGGSWFDSTAFAENFPAVRRRFLLWLANMGNGYGYGNLEDHDVVNFIDNHDVQRDVTFHRGVGFRI